MGASMRIGRWGSSLAVRIPKAIAERWHISEGSLIEMVPQDDQVVMRKQAYNLADLLADVTPDNLHQGQDIGESRDGEWW